MFENAIWIGLERCENAPWKGERLKGAEIEGKRGQFQVENGSIVFRKEFVLREKPQSARLAICGLGYYDVYINGKRPDERRVLSPVYSDYFNLVRYDVYSIADLLHTGDNVVAVEVCGGWFSPPEKWWGWRMMWHGNPRMIAELSLTYESGACDKIISDESWRVTHGAVVESCIYDGEKVDFNRIPTNWKEIGFDASEWNYAISAEAPTDNLTESLCPPVRINRVLQPVGVNRLSDTEYVYDFGENGSGLPRVLVKGKKGDVVKLNFSEYINPDGTLDKASENRAINEDVYTLSGDGIDVCHPRFTWHGYRYCMISLSDPEIEIVKAEKCVIHSDLETIGHFECGNDKLNRLHEAYLRTELADLIGIPLDCNQRDERLPWLGDAWVTSELCLYNFDMQSFYASFLEDLRVGRDPQTKKVAQICPRHEYRGRGPSIDWNLAYPFILMRYYERYGSLDLLKAHYEALREHTDSYIKECVDGMIPPSFFGDWFSVDMPNGMERVGFGPGPEEHRQNPPFAGTMFFCELLRLTAEIALLLGDEKSADHYTAQRELSVKVLRERCYDRDKGIFGSGGQFLLTYALSERIIPEEDRERVFGNLLKALEETDWHMLMGVVGTCKIFDLLIDFGRQDVAYKLLTAEGYPSPLYMIEGGRTTLPEGLDGHGSGCHCMFASPDTALYRLLGGITVNRRKASAISIRPYCPEGLDYACCSQKLAEGVISSSWKRAGDEIVFEIEIPEGCTADLALANGEKKKETLLKEGRYTFVL